jgi:hypothetical protein
MSAHSRQLFANTGCKRVTLAQTLYDFERMLGWASEGLRQPALGHGILPDTPYESVTALVEMAHEMSATAARK